MTTVDGFLDILTWVNAFYTNFNFKLKDDKGNPSTQFHVWYEVLSPFDEDLLMKAVKSFCKENTYPPSSPAQILEYIKSKLLTVSESGEMVFERVIASVRRNAYDLDKVIEIETQVVANTLKELRSDFKAWYNDSDQLPFLKRNFIKQYEKNLTNSVSHQVSQGRLETQNIKLLGE
jgi:hypothetical protein